MYNSECCISGGDWSSSRTASSDRSWRNGCRIPQCLSIKSQVQMEGVSFREDTHTHTHYKPRFRCTWMKAAVSRRLYTLCHGGYRVSIAHELIGLIHFSSSALPAYFSLTVCFSSLLFCGDDDKSKPALKCISIFKIWNMPLLCILYIWLLQSSRC